MVSSSTDENYLAANGAPARNRQSSDDSHQIMHENEDHVPEDPVFDYLKQPQAMQGRRTSSLAANFLEKEQMKTQLEGVLAPRINESHLRNKSSVHPGPEYHSLRDAEGGLLFSKSHVNGMQPSASQALLDRNAMNRNAAQNFEERQASQGQRVSLLSRDVDCCSNQSFFSRVMDDIHIYRANTRLHNEENLMENEIVRINESIDDSFTKDRQVTMVTEYTLKAWDFLLYLIGMLVRIQTIVLGFILFKVETENVCVVQRGVYQPVPMAELPADFANLPRNLIVESHFFQQIIFGLFVTSCVTSVLYINKVVQVIKYHRSSKQVYEENAIPSVRAYKLLNFLFGLSHLACCIIFLTHAGRVCSGWYISSKLSEEEKENIDKDVYLIARGGYFVVASVFGLCNLIGFLVTGRNAIN